MSRTFTPDDGHDRYGLNIEPDEAFGRAMGEHEALPELLDAVIVEVARERVFDVYDELPDGDAVSDEQILTALDWDGPRKRKQKWMWMLGEFLSRPTVSVSERFNEAADAVAIYMDSCNTASTVTAGLRRETFDEEISISVPREVLHRVDKQVEKREGLTYGEVREAHRDAVDNQDAPI